MGFEPKWLAHSITGTVAQFGAGEFGAGANKRDFLALRSADNPCRWYRTVTRKDALRFPLRRLQERNNFGARSQAIK